MAETEGGINFGGIGGNVSADKIVGRDNTEIKFSLPIPSKAISEMGLSSEIKELIHQGFAELQQAGEAQNEQQAAASFAKIGEALGAKLDDAFTGLLGRWAARK